MGDPAVLEARGVTRRFGAFTALDGVDFAVGAGEIVALLGENGAGKSTLMNVLSGLLAPTSGALAMDGEPVTFSSPAGAAARGIGMVHQHFLLVPTLSVAENLLLSAGARSGGILSYPLADVLKKAQILAGRLGWTIPWNDLAGSLPVGTQQRVEILNALRLQTRVLIFDEPTAVLTPTETPELFATIRRLAAEGRGIVFISHKLDEVRVLAERVTVLRRGRVVFDGTTENTTEAELATAMVGVDSDAAVLLDAAAFVGKPPVPGSPESHAALEVRDIALSAPQVSRPLLRDISFAVAPGEVFGIAGVDGNGQEELAAVLSGLARPSSGTVHIGGVSPAPSALAFRRAGVAVIPADRQARGLILPMTVTENIALGVYDDSAYRAGFLLRWNRLKARAKTLIESFDIRANSADSPAASLSGGNQQKVVIARALSARPKVIIAVNPTRGLDVGAVAYVYNALRTAQANGAAVVLISTELGEVLTLTTRRVAVLSGGRFAGVVSPDTPREQIGLLMGGRSGRGNAK